MITTIITMTAVPAVITENATKPLRKNAEGFLLCMCAAQSDRDRKNASGAFPGCPPFSRTQQASQGEEFSVSFVPGTIKMPVLKSQIFRFKIQAGDGLSQQQGRQVAQMTG